jgi:hypothetical protein
VKFAGGAFRNATLRSINESMHPAYLHLDARETLELPPLLEHTSRSPRSWSTTSNGGGGTPHPRPARHRARVSTRARDNRSAADLPHACALPTQPHVCIGGPTCPGSSPHASMPWSHTNTRMRSRSEGRKSDHEAIHVKQWQLDQEASDVGRRRLDHGQTTARWRRMTTMEERMETPRHCHPLDDRPPLAAARQTGWRGRTSLRRRSL